MCCQNVVVIKLAGLALGRLDHHVLQHHKLSHGMEDVVHFAGAVYGNVRDAGILDG